MTTRVPFQWIDIAKEVNDNLASSTPLSVIVLSSVPRDWKDLRIETVVVGSSSSSSLNTISIELMGHSFTIVYDEMQGAILKIMRTYNLSGKPTFSIFRNLMISDRKATGYASQFIEVL